MLSALFIQTNISVGASGAVFGLLGGMLSELITNWTLYANKVFIKILLLELWTSRVIVTFLLVILCKCPVCSIIDPRDHRCGKLGSGNPPTCGQFCSYWRIFFWFSSWVCVSDTPAIWMG